MGSMSNLMPVDHVPFFFVTYVVAWGNLQRDTRRVQGCALSVTKVVLTPVQHRINTYCSNRSPMS